MSNKIKKFFLAAASVLLLTSQLPLQASGKVRGTLCCTKDGSIKYEIFKGSMEIHAYDPSLPKTLKEIISSPICRKEKVNTIVYMPGSVTKEQMQHILELNRAEMKVSINIYEDKGFEVYLIKAVGDSGDQVSKKKFVRGKKVVFPFSGKSIILFSLPGMDPKKVDEITMENLSEKISNLNSDIMLALVDFSELKKKYSDIDVEKMINIKKLRSLNASMDKLIVKKDSIKDSGEKILAYLRGIEGKGILSEKTRALLRDTENKFKNFTGSWAPKVEDLKAKIERNIEHLSTILDGQLFSAVADDFLEEFERGSVSSEASENLKKYFEGKYGEIDFFKLGEKFEKECLDDDSEEKIE